MLDNVDIWSRSRHSHSESRYLYFMLPGPLAHQTSGHQPRTYGVTPHEDVLRGGLRLWPSFFCAYLAVLIEKTKREEFVDRSLLHPPRICVEPSIRRARYWYFSVRLLDGELAGIFNRRLVTVIVMWESL